MNSEQINLLWKEKVFPRFLIALVLTLLAIFLNFSPLLNFVTSLIPQPLNYVLATTVFISLVIAISSFPALISPLFKKVLVSIIGKFQKASIIKAVVLAIFEDLLSVLSYLLGFLVGALALPNVSLNVRLLLVFGIIFVLTIFLLIRLYAYFLENLMKKR
jgi:hypothetical protein